MKKVILTPKKIIMPLSRISENDTYITNGFWLIDKTKIDIQKIKSLYVYWYKLGKDIQDIPYATCQKVIFQAQEGNVEKLSTDNMVKDLGYGYLHIDFTSNRGDITRVNSTFLRFMERLGAVTFKQTQTYNYQPMLCYNKQDELIGLIMPMRI